MKQYVPYDLSLEEDKETLRTMWVIDCDAEFPITGIDYKSVRINGKWVTPINLLKHGFIDARTGEPCGKFKEENNELRLY